MNNQITITSPLDLELLFESMHMTEGLSSLGEMQLSFLSEKADLSPEDLLGQAVTVSVVQPDEETREFSGYVTRFSLGPSRGRFHSYHATVRPWLWFLTRTSDCKVFQEMTVPDIVKKVFADHPVSTFDFRLFRQYRTWNYCVQYRESDFNFVSRLLEHEGIYWYFEHKDGQHKLVLVDSSSAHDAVPGRESLPFFENRESVPPDVEYVSSWHFAREIRTGKTVLTSYDFERPSHDLRVEKSHPRSHEQDKQEQFDYQGDYITNADGDQMVEDRLNEQQTRFQSLHGSSNGQAITVGRLLSLEKHPRDDQNTKYLITTTTIEAQITGYESGSGACEYGCDFDAVPADQQYRPPRHTPKPFVQGPQSAVIVGPSGEEIYTDKYGRVKLQFHWDRYGKKDEKSSCWVRVSHPWAGKNYGAIHIPRIGQEVVVSFLEGDPDQPLITGRVYNAEQMPPWDLPANATQSGILTRSSKGGGYANANAIRFEDKKGSEELWIHAEKDQRIEVENDESHSVGHDRSKTVGHDETTQVAHDRTETVGNNETITIGVNRVETVGSNETITIGSNRTETVGSNETITIGANRTETVGANETITIGGNRTITVAKSETATVALQRTHTVGINETIAIGAAQEVAIGAMQTITVGANQSTTVGRNRGIDVGSNLATQVGGGEKRTIGKGRATTIGADDTLSVGKNLAITAADSISITTGSASIVMKKDGTITIKGKDITIEGSGKINVKASSDVVMKGSKILQN